MGRSGQWNMSLDVARRVALAAQGFADPAPANRVDRRHMQRVMSRLRVLQLDSIPVVIRTQYMPFHSRLGPYDSSLLDVIAYRDDEWFEAWAHEASLLPVSSEPLFRWMRDRAMNGATWKHLYEAAQREPAYVQSVLDEVRDRGAITGGELSDPRRVAGDDSGWGSRSLGTVALDWLYRIGELGVRRRGNFEKVFSPIEKIIPADVLGSATPAVDDAQRELIVQSVQSLGVGTASDIADYFRLPIREIRALLPDLVEDGKIIPATVKGWGEPAFADPHAKTPRSIVGSTALSPFDPVVWKRDRAERFWNFEYRIEIYVPEAKRRWGYYVLPVMVDGHLVARIDVKNDREAGIMRLKASHAEVGYCTAESAERVADAMRDLAQFVGAESIDVEQRGDLAKHLAQVI
ncbi:MAG: crosslink repair DNA glycosylase YcaQ family protein [Acidimicrobiia bacterium]|nr:crosslink repair DNA glycosylase YcaQ family protein [Acidimicrobiia bacterium]